MIYKVLIIISTINKNIIKQIDNKLENIKINHYKEFYNKFDELLK